MWQFTQFMKLRFYIIWTRNSIPPKCNECAKLSCQLKPSICWPAVSEHRARLLINLLLMASWMLHPGMLNFVWNILQRKLQETNTFCLEMKKKMFGDLLSLNNHLIWWKISVQHRNEIYRNYFDCVARPYLIKTDLNKDGLLFTGPGEEHIFFFTRNYLLVCYSLEWYLQWLWLFVRNQSLRIKYLYLQTYIC